MNLIIMEFAPSVQKNVQVAWIKIHVLNAIIVILKMKFLTETNLINVSAIIDFMHFSISALVSIYNYKKLKIK
jgi:hypothetical protein